MYMHKNNEYKNKKKTLYSHSTIIFGKYLAKSLDPWAEFYYLVSQVLPPHRINIGMTKMQYRNFFVCVLFTYRRI